MIPTSTGAARAISKVLPKLEGRLEGSAIRVPTVNVSLIDFTFMPRRAVTAGDVNEAVRLAAMGPLLGVLGYETAPLVSSDFNHSPYSSIFAPAQTTVTRDGMVRVLCWYDNEWGFSNRMIDTASYWASVLTAADAPELVPA
jgi:glyceraldehyde 3-phosphate dehydrogenase